MKHLFHVTAAALFPLLVSCQAKKQTIEAAREEQNTALKQSLYMESAKLDSMSDNFIAEFDSLILFFEQPIDKGLKDGADIKVNTATKHQGLVKAKVYGGRIDTKRNSVSASSTHTQSKDSLLHLQQRTADVQSHSDNTVVGKPPNLWLLYIIVAIMLIATIFFKRIR